MSHGAHLPPYPLHLFNIRTSLQSSCMSTADDIFMGSRQFWWKPLLGFNELLNGTCTYPDSKFPVFCCNWSSCQYTLCVCTSLQYQCGLLQLSCKQGERYRFMLKRMFQLILLIPLYPTTMYVVHMRAAIWTPSLTVLPQGFPQSLRLEAMIMLPLLQDSEFTPGNIEIMTMLPLPQGFRA